MAKATCRVGVGGPVGSGKTALIETLTPRLLAMGLKVVIITNDIVTTEDAQHVRRILRGTLAEERIAGVETGACPHTAVREDPSMNLAAVEEMEGRFPDTDLLFIDDQYAMSEIWTKKEVHTTTESEVLGKGVPKAMLLFKTKVVAARLSELQAELQREDISEDEQLEIAAKMVKLNRLKVILAHKTNRSTI